MYGHTSLETLASELGTSHRTLRRAVREGTVRCRRPTPRRVYVDGREDGYLHSHWTLLADLRAGLRTEPNVASAILFGSVARGDDGPDSDVDLLVEFRAEDWRTAGALAARLSERLGRPVEVVPLGAATRNPNLLAEVVESGRPLVDRVGRWAKLQAREARIRAAAADREADLRARAGAVLSKASP